jgi:hypothetical protein
MYFPPPLSHCDDKRPLKFFQKKNKAREIHPAAGDHSGDLNPSTRRY